MKALESLKKSKEYRNKPNLIYWIVGARRIGKTDLALQLACLLYSCYGRKTMWIRNKLVETAERGFYLDFLNDGVKFGWASEDWITDATGVWDGKTQIIKFQSLSTFSNRRGAAHPDTDLIIIDEFCPEDRKYPKNAVMGLMSLTKTVFAGREHARVFAFSNIVSAANPYFAKLHIYPSKNDITLFPDKLMLIERCKGYKCAISEANPWNEVYKAAKYDDYADESEDALIDLVCSMPKHAKPDYYAVMRDGMFYRPYLKGDLTFWRYEGNHPPAGKTVIYAVDITDVNDRIALLPNFLKKGIELQTANNIIRFDSPNTMYQILSIIYDV